MHIKTYLLLLILTLALLACVNDSTTGTKGSQSAQPAELTKPSTPATNNPAKRPTEEMTVNMNGKQISPPTRNKPATATNKTTNNTATKAGTPTKSDKPVPKRTPDKIPPGSLPSACDLVTENYISEVLGIVEARDIYVKDGSGPNPYKSDSRSCFFKWPHNGDRNAGVLIQVQRNSYPEEFPDWAKYYITSKKQQGDKLPDESVTYRYKDFPDMGEDGAYNYDLARYLWRIKSGHVIMIAFNLPSSEPEQLMWASKIGKVVEKNFQEILKKK